MLSDQFPQQKQSHSEGEPLSDDVPAGQSQPAAVQRDIGDLADRVADPDTPPQYADTLGNVWRGYNRSLRLGTFADAGRSPRIADVEIAVCFADLRGFTNYVHNLQRIGHDNRVQHFLRAYFQIYPKAVLRAMWDLEPDAATAKQDAEIAEAARLIVPTTYKNLGDGMMIVWELQETSDITVQGFAARKIFSTIEYIQKYFTELTTDLGPVEMDAYSKYVSQLKMGFGLARGHAWRLDFGRNMPIDYAGSIVNLAARLQSLARPEGVVAQLGFAESLFHELAEAGSGSVAQIAAPRGLGAEPIDIYSRRAEISAETLVGPDAQAVVRSFSGLENQ